MFSFNHFMNKNRVATDNTIDVAFNSWLNTQNKFYSSPAEKTYRRSVFAANYQKVAQMNQIYTHRSEMNKFGDLTEDEFIAKYTGLNYDANAPKNYVHLESNGDVKPIDWRTKGAVNKIKDQAQCGSCWAFSATGAVEGWAATKGQGLKSLAEQQLVDCAGSVGNQGCNGGWPNKAIGWLANRGACSESSYPYTARDGSCKQCSSVTKPGGVSTGSGESTLAGQLSSLPVSVCVDASGGFQHYSGGVFSGPCGTQINHAILAVGYTSSYWIVKNSWGTSWGSSGYIYMKRGSNLCGVLSNLAWGK
jgi:C1A family cysteine protease